MTALTYGGYGVSKTDKGFEVFKHGERRAVLPTAKSAWDYIELLTGMPIPRHHRLTSYLGGRDNESF